MLAISEVKELLGDENISDEHALKLRDALYELADLALGAYRESARQHLTTSQTEVIGESSGKIN